MLDRLTDALTRRLGPLPVWAWGLLAGGALLVWRMRQAGGPGGEDAESAVRRVLAGTTLTEGAVWAPAESPGIERGEDDDGGESYRTNADWLRDASKQLVSQGHSPSAVDTALRSYLLGRPLDAEQVRLIDAALRAEGPPPEGAPPITRAPEDDQPDQPRRRKPRRKVRRPRTRHPKRGRGSGEAPQDSKRSYTIQSGDTLWGIAERFYGSGSRYRRLWRANRRVLSEAARRRGQEPSPNRIWPGTRISIP